MWGPSLADAKISQLPDGGTIQPSDQVPVNRAGTTVRATGAGGGGSSFNGGTITEQLVLDNTAGNDLPLKIIGGPNTSDVFGIYDYTAPNSMNFGVDNFGYISTNGIDASSVLNLIVGKFHRQTDLGQTEDVFSVFHFSGARLHLTAAGAFVFEGLPTADPHVVGQVWNSAGTLKISAG
jgi:hypothetical protein